MFLFLLFVFILIRLLTKGNIGGYQAIRKVRIKVFLDSFGACPMVRLAAAWQRQSAMGWLALLAKCINASCSALRSVRRGVVARLEARMDSLLSFHVGLFHPYNMPVYPGALRVTDCSSRVVRSAF